MEWIQNEECHHVDVLGNVQVAVTYMMGMSQTPRTCMMELPESMLIVLIIYL